MTYLDDEDHEWSIDPGATRRLDFLLLELSTRSNREANFNLDMIARGYLGLRERLPDATPAQCLDTAMIWYYG